MKKSLMDSASWTLLSEHASQLQGMALRSLFNENKERFQNFSLDLAPLFFDYSKNFITQQTIDLFCSLAEERELPVAIENLMTGKLINVSEKRNVGHTALRDQTELSKKNEISTVLQQMRNFVESVHNKQYPSSEVAISDVIHIGIGGSDLGPGLFYEAFHLLKKNIRCHFVSTYDEQGIKDLLNTLNAAKTLVVIVSKSFTTKETLFNADCVRRWLFESLNDTEQTSKRLLAVTADIKKAEQWGIKPPQIFPIWDHVGGRYSIWSAVSLSVALAIGMDAFEQLLKGAHFIDHHFQTAPLQKNIPVLLGMLGVWYRHFFDANHKAIISYSPRLKMLHSYLQQLFMESQGKHVSMQGESLSYPKGMIIWGDIGTNSQHSFHQFLFQSSEFIPIDFVLPIKNHMGAIDESNLQMIAHCLAQSKVLLEGRNCPSLLTYQQIPGNQPSNLILMDELTPFSLGALLAFYEHCVFVQSTIWEINPFDQWGVEYSKTISKEIYDLLMNKTVDVNYDASTNGLLKKIGQIEI